MAIVVRTSGNRENLLPPEGSTSLTLEQMQEAVGGYIEIVPTNDGRLLIVNEEGKLNGFEVNTYATALTRGVVAENDLIVGDVILALDTEVE